MSPDSQPMTFTTTIGLAEINKVLHTPDSAQIAFY